MSYSQTLSITEVQRDSIYNKIQRGIINAERVTYLNNALKACDSIKKLQVNYIGVMEAHSNLKDNIIENDKVIITSLKENVSLEKERGRKKAFWSFLKGVAVGIVGSAALVLL